jgi:uncharacterized membrane protein HdeD (DUF308 family)
MEIKKRWNSKTPKFWKKVQRIGLVAGALGAALVSAPVTLPAVLVSASGYLIAVGGVAAALSQLTVEDKSDSID